jgi:hypothetical protein
MSTPATIKPKFVRMLSVSAAGHVATLGVEAADLDALKAIVGGNIEIVDVCTVEVGTELCACVDQDRLLNHLPYNIRATDSRLARTYPERSELGGWQAESVQRRSTPLVLLRDATIQISRFAGMVVVRLVWRPEVI